MQEIKQIDIKEIIQAAGIELNKGNFGLCPFHTEKTPSFHVKAHTYNCYGCGEHGDAANFVQKFYNKSFPEALEFLGIKTDKPPEIIKYETQLNREFFSWKEQIEYTFNRLIYSCELLMESLCPDSEAYGEVYGLKEQWAAWTQVLNSDDRIGAYRTLKGYKLFEYSDSLKFFKELQKTDLFA